MIYSITRVTKYELVSMRDSFLGIKFHREACKSKKYFHLYDLNTELVSQNCDQINI